MIFRKYKFFFVFVVLLLLMNVKTVYASDKCNYTISTSDTNTFIDSSNTTALVDTDNRQITLPKLASPDIIKFSQPGTYSYAVLTDDGVKQYEYDGNKMVNINSLSVSVTDPISLAVSPYYPGFIVTKMDNSNNITASTYNYDPSGMQENPALEISGLKYIYSISTMKDSSQLAVLAQDSMKMYGMTDSSMVEIPSLAINNLKDPIQVAASDGYSIAIMGKEKIEWYKFNGNSMVNVPALEIAFDDSFKRPSAIAVKDNTTTILDDNQIKTYTINNGKYEYNAALSIIDGLNKPVSIALKEDSSDLIVLDKIDVVNNIYQAKYFMFDGSKYVLNKTLSENIKNVLSGNRYSDTAEVISNAFITKWDYSDMVRIRTYTEIPKNTEIDFYVSNEGDTVTNAKWIESWKIKNDGDGVLGTVYKAVPNSDGTYNYVEFGDASLSYPTFDTKVDNTNYNYSNSDLNVTTDGNGNLIMNANNQDTQMLNLWTKISVGNVNDAKVSGKYKNIRFKAVLKTTNAEVTPKIYVPLGNNNDSNLTDPNEIALTLDAGTVPLAPTINPIDPGQQDPSFTPVDGWVYTTTPTISWNFEDVDTDQKQNAFQLIVMARNLDNDSWTLAYNSMKIDSNLGQLTNFKIPTSYDNPLVDGPLFQSGSYEFAVFTRTWDTNEIVSDYSNGKDFKVLAFERPRISNIVYPPDEKYKDLGINAPKQDDILTYAMILPGMKIDQLPAVEAGAEVTLMVDSVGPIMSSPSQVPKFYITINGTNYDMNLSDCEAQNNLGLASTNNRWKLRFFTNAPIDQIPDNTLVMCKLVGEGEIGGTTVFYMPNYSDGVVKTFDTIYSDWHVQLQGRDAY